MQLLQGSTPFVNITCDDDQSLLGAFPSAYATAIVGGGTLGTGAGPWQNFGSSSGNMNILCVNLTAVDTGTPGDLVVYALDSSGNILGHRDFQVVPYDPIDGPYPIGTPAVNVTEWAGNMVAFNGAPVVDVENWAGFPLASITQPAIPGDAMTLLTGAINAIGTEVWQGTVIVDTGCSPLGAMQLILAACAGTLQVSGTTVTIQDTTGSINRIQMTVDSLGQRSSPTYNHS